ncbi:MAG: LysR family transcriptional regulator [Bacteroidota bacterium]
MEEKKYTRYSNIRINYKLWMSSETGDAIIDDDKWQLLIAIQKHGSLKAASDVMDISYRKVWGDLKKIEEILGFSIIEKHRGGKDGGVTYLTEEGAKLIRDYIEFRAEFQDAVDTIIKKFKKKLKS